jgi:hypothetical protein
LALFRNLLEGNFTVRQTEARVPHRRARSVQPVDPNLLAAEQRMRSALGAKVAIKRQPDLTGEVRISFQNEEDLKTIIQRIAGSEDA